MINDSIFKRLLFSIMVGLMLPAVPMVFFQFISGAALLEAIGVTLGLELFGIPAPVLYFCCERWLPKRTILKHLLFFGYWFAWFSFLMYEYNYAPEGAALSKAAAIGASMFSVVSYLTILLTKPNGDQ